LGLAEDENMDLDCKVSPK